MKKVIAVAGHSGAGKTTCSGFLAETLGADHIHADVYLKQTPFLCPEIYEKIYRQKPDLKDVTKTIDIIKSGSHEHEKEYISLVLPTINSLLQKDYQDFKKNDKSFLLLDWIDIAITDLWKTADYKVLVCSSRENRHKALDKRQRKNGYFDESIGARRDIAHRDAVRHAENTSNVILFNNYNETFFEHIKTISEGMFKGKSPAKLTQFLSGTEKKIIDEIHLDGSF